MVLLSAVVLVAPGSTVVVRKYPIWVSPTWPNQDLNPDREVHLDKDTVAMGQRLLSLVVGKTVVGTLVFEDDTESDDNCNLPTN